MDIEKTLANQRIFFNSQKTLSYEFRCDNLHKLRQVIKKNENEIIEALKTDFNKPSFETYTTEIMMVYEEIDAMIRHLKKYMKPTYHSTGITNFPSIGTILKQPYGVVLIMSPWNYPFMLTLSPLVGAIAAGDCAVIKPSNYSNATSNLIAKMLQSIFPEEYITTVLGGRESNQALLEQRFDFIFFTGGYTVGKLVMEKASRYCTPLILELGGKSPCIIDATADLKLAAKRAVWGKFINAGQTCVAPDYFLVDRSIAEEFKKEVVKTIQQFYYTDGYLNKDFPHIIKDSHVERLRGLINPQQVLFGGKIDMEQRLIEPTVLWDVKETDLIMQEEIFGPLLPIVLMDSLQASLAFINQREKPLAFYIFSTSKANIAHALKSTSSGGGCVNNVVMHVACHKLPFGGVGASGMGNYHGKQSFLAFSHQRSILKQANWLDVPIKYPPYLPSKEKIIRKFIK